MRPQDDETMPNPGSLTAVFRIDTITLLILVSTHTLHLYMGVSSGYLEHLQLTAPAIKTHVLGKEIISAL
jgi:hypothetical protein